MVRRARLWRCATCEHRWSTVEVLRVDEYDDDINAMWC